MIISKAGRSYSVRTQAEDDTALQQDIDTLSADEREALTIMLTELEGADPEQERLIDLMSSAEYARTPVDIVTFIKDPYYLGNTCSNLYDRHLADLEELFKGGYHEAIWTGAIGTGKTFTATVGLCRVLYELSCLKDPHASFGLAKDSNISFVCLSVNEVLAMKVVFENVATKLGASPYFREHFPYAQTKKELRFPHNIWLAARASTDTSVLGLNVIGSMIDETNFMARPQSMRDKRHGAVDHAETLYLSVKRRMKSRFERHGKLPGILFLVSSKRMTDDFTERRIRQAKSDPTVFVRDYALWEVKPEEYFSTERFWVVCGNEQVPSRILTNDEADRFRDNLPDGVTLIDVPCDFRADFDGDLEGSIRDIAGISTVAVSPFIQRREKIQSAVNSDYKHPFSAAVYDPSKGGQFIWHLLTKQGVEKDFSGAEHAKLRPLLNPQCTRHVHIDPSWRKDSTGFCMAHISGWRDVLRKSDDGTVFQERAPIYTVDVLLQIVPPVGDEIVLGDVRRLVYELSMHGFTITLVSQDTWQSVDALQQLKARGYHAEHLSVDTKLDPYESLKTALYEDRVILYDYPPLLKELRELEKDEVKKKVDHPARGSKDISDALAGCLYTLSLHQVHQQPLPMMKGLSYSPDAWMDEQLQYAAASEFAPQGGPGDNPLPILGGSTSMVDLVDIGGDDWGTGWNPGSL